MPLMSISEQLAEKIIGWAVSGLLKHYLDADRLIPRCWCPGSSIRISGEAAAGAPERMRA